MPKLIDDIVICVAVGVSLLIALALSWMAFVHHAEIPPTLISTFLGIVVAALTYRFLGGSAGTEFSVGLLKLGGSAALLLGTTWFVGDRMRDEIRLYSETKAFREQITSLSTERDHLVQTVTDRDGAIDTLQRRLAGAPSARGRLTIEEIKKLRPDDPFIRDLRQLVAGQEGPFSPTLREISVRIAVVVIAGDQPMFNICPDTLGKLNEGIDVPQTRVKLSRAVGAQAESASVTADRAGKIDLDFCQNAQREFDMQINCQAALRLFPDVLSTCAEGVKARGMRVTLGALSN